MPAYVIQATRAGEVRYLGEAEGKLVDEWHYPLHKAPTEAHVMGRKRAKRMLAEVLCETTAQESGWRLEVVEVPSSC